MAAVDLLAAGIVGYHARPCSDNLLHVLGVATARGNGARSRPPRPAGTAEHLAAQLRRSFPCHDLRVSVRVSMRISCRMRLRGSAPQVEQTRHVQGVIPGRTPPIGVAVPRETGTMGVRSLDTLT